jgi:hypothetical protein
MATLPAAWSRPTAISSLTLCPAWSVPSSLLRLTCSAGALADQATAPPSAVSVIGAVEPARREMRPGDTVRVPADAEGRVTAGGGRGRGNAGIPGVGTPGVAAPGVGKPGVGADVLGLVALLMTASPWPPAVSVRTG